MSIDEQSKVIGYLACISEEEVLCDGDACIIAGSEDSINKYLSHSPRGLPHKLQIKKARFGDIITGIKLGGAYSFDEDSYNRFYPLANKNGYNFENQDFSSLDDGEPTFFTIRPRV